MGIYKEYLNESIDFDAVYEELTSTNILDFYAGWWVLQQPTHPNGNIREPLMEDIRNRWNKVKREVQGDLLSEGVIAILSEAHHTTSYNIGHVEFYNFMVDNGISLSGTTNFDEITQIFDDIRQGDEVESNIDNLGTKMSIIFDDPQTLPRNKEFFDTIINRLADLEFDFFNNEFDEKFIRQVDEIEDLLSQRKEVILGRELRNLIFDFFRFNEGTSFSGRPGPWDVPLKWPDTKKKIQSIIGKSERLSTPSLFNLLVFFRDKYFADSVNWNSNFGGEPWAVITENILELWNKYPTADFEFIDHIIDLAHNTDTWLDKFAEGESLLDALDLKFSARTPKEYVDQLSDRKIIAGVKRVQV